MKAKTLLFIVGISLSMFSYARQPKIAIDRQDGDSARVIEVELFNIYSRTADAAVMALGSMEFIDNGVAYQTLYLKIYFNEYPKMEFKNGNILLLKFEDNTTMELTNIYDYKWYEYHSGNQLRLPYAIYPVTTEQLVKLSTNNVIKIRVQDAVEFFDREIKSEKITNGLAKSIPVLFGYAKQDFKDVRADF